jgi:hypothetical protein
MPEGSESVAPKEHTPLISLVFAYYENPSMLELQWKEIAEYPASVKDKGSVRFLYVLAHKIRNR